MSNRKYIQLVAGLTALIASQPAHAGEPLGALPGELSANIGFTSNYIFRGITQSDEQPALQGGFDYSAENGLYLGVWGSSVDFNDGDEAQLEADIYGGWAGEYQGIGIDLGVIYYAYPGANSALDYGYGEITLALSYDFSLFSAGVGLNYSPDYFASSGDFYYPYVDITVPLIENLSLTSHAGYNDIDDEASFGVSDYWDYSAGIAYDDFYGFGLAAIVTDTDLDGSNCADGCDTSLVFSIRRDF